MANYKRGKCRYQGKTAHYSETSRRAQLGLKPVALPKRWWAGLVFLDRIQIDWGDRSRGLKHNRGYPRWHDIVFHTRPRRGAEKRLETKILRGADPESLNWPLEKKPHKYYW